MAYITADQRGTGGDWRYHHASTLQHETAQTTQERWLLRQFRYLIETLNSQLTEHFHCDRPGGKSERELLGRLCYKLAAHTCGLAILSQFSLSSLRLDLLVWA